MQTNSLIHRLNRAQGQIEAIKKELAKEQPDCLATFRLVKASQNALKKFAEAYAQENLEHCFEQNKNTPQIKEGLKEVIQSAFSL